MTTAASEIRRWIVDAIRDESVALAAGVDYATWASETVPRVFIGQSGYIGARNRGRLPFVEVTTESQLFQDETGSGGTIHTRVNLRLHATGRDMETTSDSMAAIMTAAIASIRDNRENNYTQLGDDTIEDIKPGPLGWLMEATMQFEHSYDRDTYEIQ